MQNIPYPAITGSSYLFIQFIYLFIIQYGTRPINTTLLTYKA